jgi:Spy/CpxP family protein refolding chaperone
MAGFMVGHALGAVDATDEQREEIGGIVDEAAAKIRITLSDVNDPEEQFKSLLAAETIDRAAFEALRQQMLETADAVSAQAMEALFDAAEVLTPEQRIQLVEHGKGFGPGPGRGFGPSRH